MLVVLVTLLIRQLESTLDCHQARYVSRWRRRVEHERWLAGRVAPRVEPVERPVAGVGRQPLMLEAMREVVAVRDAMAIADDERRTFVRFGLEERLHRLRILRADRDPRDVDVTVGHRHQAEILFGAGLPATANFAAAPVGVDFDCCPPVFEYTSVSSTRMLTFAPLART